MITAIILTMAAIIFTLFYMLFRAAKKARKQMDAQQPFDEMAYKQPELGHNEGIMQEIILN